MVVVVVVDALDIVAVDRKIECLVVLFGLCIKFLRVALPLYPSRVAYVEFKTLYLESKENEAHKRLAASPN